MGIRQAWSDIRELRRELSELSQPSSREEEAGYKLAVSARRFSRRSKRVVDDKLNFSATLMRAGEVDAANRLLEEFERDIRTEEAALIECVNEVKVARSLRRDRMSRLRLVRIMAVALLGACVMSFSALGIAVAGMFHDRANNDVAAQAARRGATAAVTRGAPVRAIERSRRTMRALEDAGARQSLTAHQLQTVRALAASGDDAELADFLLSVLPATVAQKVNSALGVAKGAAEAAASPLPEVNVQVDSKPKKAAKKHSEEAAAKAEEEKEEAKESNETTEEPTGGDEEPNNDDKEDGSDDAPDPLPDDPDDPDPI